MPKPTKSIETSIIVPCYNEKATIHLLLDALYEQTYPRDAMEVVIADGMSNDGTLDAIQAWQSQHPDLAVTVVENHARVIPAALNTAIKASKGTTIVRLDAHSRPDPHYVERSVTALAEGRGQNVGGVWDIQPGSDHWMARSIAVAAGHPIGVGDAKYRYSDQPGYVDTVPFGAFTRELLTQVGLFDETLLSNEDYEFNTRIRQAGGKIWFDPQIRTVYYARQNLAELARQYWRYGFWKVHMLRRYPNTIRWRQALPPLLVAGLVLLVLLTPFIRWAGYLLAGILVVYSTTLILAGFHLSVKHKTIVYALGVPLAIACMHFSWGAGFLWGIISPQQRKKG
ncbi:MAG: glycosyltransferase family 2 protein [Porticoccaceae bacterium]|nr:glycosyltransferase family 2 protein [Porticoccaceae bacterium]